MTPQSSYTKHFSKSLTIHLSIYSVFRVKSYSFIILMSLKSLKFVQATFEGYLKIKEDLREKI